MDFLKYSYFDLLPEELILEILHYIDDHRDLDSLLGSSGKISMVYFDNKARVNRQLIINSIPELKDVIDDEFTLSELSTILLESSIDKLKDIIKRTDGELLVGLSSSETDWKISRESLFKLYNLIFRYKLKLRYPISYNKIKKYKFTKQIVPTMDYIRPIREFANFFIIPTYMKIMMEWVHYYETTGLTIEKSIVNTITKDYVLTYNDYESITSYGYLILINNHNFNLEIQSEDVLLSVMHFLYMNDTDVYRQFVRGLSQSKKLKMLEEIKNDYQDQLQIDEEYPYSELYNDMLIDFISRV